MGASSGAPMGYEAWLFLIEAALLVALPLAAELGFRLGRYEKPRVDQGFASQVGVVQATAFAILGLLAAFTISMAEARFSGRRALILDEANAIGTTYLRSKYLPEPHPAELARLFREYVDVRVAFHDAGDDVAATERAMADSTRLQREIWAHAVAAARDHPAHGDSITAFIESLNEMIDLENARVLAIVTHVPANVLGLVALVGLFACLSNGYACGLGGRRVWLAVTLLPIVVAIALCVILDLDSPRIGLITTGQPAMLRLQETLADEPTRHIPGPP